MPKQPKPPSLVGHSGTIWLDFHRQQHKADMRYLKRLVPGDVPDWNGAIEKLRDGDPTDFFRLLPFLGHSMLKDPEVHDLSIERWFYEKDDADPAVAKRARKNLITLGKCLAHVGKGPVVEISLKSEESRQANSREKTRDRKRKFAARIKKAKEKLQAEIDARTRREIPSARERVLFKTGSLRSEKTRIARSVLEKAQNSRDTATKNAATAMLKRIQPRTLSRRKR